MPDATLRMLLDEIRGKTLKLLKDVPESQARWAPPDLHNTILWHAGHAYVVVETLTTAAVGQTPQIPDGWFEIFSWESRPAEVAADRWPPLAEVISHLESQKERLGMLVAGLTPEVLDGPSKRKAEQTVRYSILHGLHDEACHSGEIWLLRKLAADATSA